MWPSTVVGKSLRQPALLFQREARTNSKCETQKEGINKSRKSLKEGMHNKYGDKREKRPARRKHRAEDGNEMKAAELWEKRADAGHERQERPMLGGNENSRRKS